MKLIADGNCVMVCSHISIYYNKLEDVRNISVQCKMCNTEYFLSHLFQKAEP